MSSTARTSISAYPVASILWKEPWQSGICQCHIVSRPRSSWKDCVVDANLKVLASSAIDSIGAGP